MKKTLALMLLVFSMLLSLCACEEHAVQSGETPGVPLSPIPAASEPEVSPSPETSPSFDEKEIYRSFLSENYEKLSAACFGVISGIGLIDLDMDSKLEMVLFDAGASASMGVQLFDIIDGGVECISSNMVDVAEQYGGEHLSDVQVSANYFEDFRLMRDAETGELFYQIVSFNGAVDFRFYETIRFSSRDGVLTLTPVAYCYEETNIDTDEIVFTEYKLNGSVCTAEEYNTAMEQLALCAEDTGYYAKGLFRWSEPDYNDSFEGFMLMVDAAFALAE